MRKLNFFTCLLEEALLKTETEVSAIYLLLLICIQSRINFLIRRQVLCSPFLLPTGSQHYCPDSQFSSLVPPCPKRSAEHSCLLQTIANNCLLDKLVLSESTKTWTATPAFAGWGGEEVAGWRAGWGEMAAGKENPHCSVRTVAVLNK